MPDIKKISKIKMPNGSYYNVQDKVSGFVLPDGLKTINNFSIVGSGNLTLGNITYSEVLAAPTVSVSGDDVTIVAGDLISEKFDIYDDNTLLSADVTAGVHDIGYLGVGKHYIKAKAKANGYETSGFSNVAEYIVTQPRLEVPSTVSATGDSLTFDAVPGATGYKVFADGANIGEVIA